MSTIEMGTLLLSIKVAQIRRRTLYVVPSVGMAQKLSHLPNVAVEPPDSHTDTSGEVHISQQRSPM